MSKENYDRKLIRIDNAREILPNGITLKQRADLYNKVKIGGVIAIGTGTDRKAGRVIGKYPHFVLLEISTLSDPYREAFTWAELLTSKTKIGG